MINFIVEEKGKQVLKVRNDRRCIRCGILLIEPDMSGFFKKSNIDYVPPEDNECICINCIKN